MSDCLHRGDKLRRLRCHTLPVEQRKQPVHLCRVYGECTLVDTEHRLPACDGCPSLQAKKPAVAPLDRPYRFVTTLEESYAPGFLALAQSMREHAEIPFCFTVILYGSLSAETERRIADLRIDVEFVPKEDLGEFRFDRSKTKTPRMAPNFDKILMYRLPYDEPVCYSDSDMLCLSSLAGIQALEPVSVVVKQSVIGKPPDAHSAYKPRATWPWNSGWLVFRPDPQLFEEMQEYALRSYPEAVEFGDQVIQNDYYAECRPGMIRYIDMSWNTSTWVSQKFPGLFDQRSTKFLHFAHEAKPWSDAPSSPWMRKFWTLWQGYYERATKAGSIRKYRGDGRNTEGLEELIATLPAGPLKMIELGSAGGESAEIFARSGKFRKILCVDPWRNRDEFERRFDEVAARHPCIEKVKATSAEAAGRLVGPVDFIYIDACHDYEHVKQDIALWRSQVVAGGVIAGHDYTGKFPGVIQAVHEAFDRPDHVFRDGSWMVRV